MRNTYAGEYHPQWRFLSDAVKAAADHRCVRCHHPFAGDTGRCLPCDDTCDQTRGLHRSRPNLDAEAVAHYGYGFNYGVHHFDGDKSNNRWWNLMALCNSCHLKIQSSVIPERQWLFEHSDWMKPYVAGFYAYWFARQLPTREWIEDNLDHYLALGQPWLYRDPIPAAVPA